MTNVRMSLLASLLFCSAALPPPPRCSTTSDSLYRNIYVTQEGNQRCMIFACEAGRAGVLHPAD